jgi:hypothetical protein
MKFLDSISQSFSLGKDAAGGMAARSAAEANSNQGGNSSQIRLADRAGRKNGEREK